MNKPMIVLAAASVFAWFATTSLVAGDGPTAARPTAEAGFAEIRKAATAHDDAALAKALPSSLVKDWTEEAKDDAKAWRAALASQIAAGEVVRVTENGDGAIARWKTPAAVWEIRLRFDGKQWNASSPWAYCVGGGDLAKANGNKASHVKLKARQDPNAYGPSAFSFVNVTQDPKQCLNRMDLVYCRCGQVHGRGGDMFSMLKAQSIDELDGLQPGGDWMDEIVPKKGAVYVFHCNTPKRKDFQVALQITALDANAMEFDWRLVAAGKNAPLNIHAPQPLVSNDGVDGTDGICDARKK